MGVRIGKILRLSFFFSTVMVILVSCVTDTRHSADLNESTSTHKQDIRQNADELIIVSCLLPPEVRKVGRVAVHTRPRRVIRTSAWDCTKQHGEQKIGEDLLTSWLKEAATGAPQAQTMLGDIYAQGLETQRDYAEAAKWYRKAADQGFKSAQTRLGYLYESGQGVKKDLFTAMHWYSRAVGESAILGGDGADLGVLEALKQEIERKKGESEQLNQELERKREELEKIQQDLEKNKQNVETQLGRLRREQDELRNQLDLAQERQDQAQESQIKDLLAQKDAKISHLQGQIVRLTNESQSYQNEIEQLRGRLKKGPILRLVEPRLPEVAGTPVVKTSAATKQRVIGGIIAPAGVSTFTVNERDQREQLDDIGLFSVPIDVQASDVPVNLRATDKLNRSVALEFKFKPERKTPEPIDLNFGNYFALIIANQDYQEVTDLKTPINDAEKVAEILENKYNFKAKIVRNGTRDEIVSEISQFSDNLTERDNLLIYYAGHGDLDERLKPPRGYWLAVDAGQDKSIRSNWIPNIEITDFMEVTKAKHVMVVNDSCYSAALMRDAETRGVGRLQTKNSIHYKKILEARSSVILTSGGIQPVLDTIGGEHSVFAREFIKILDENDKILEGLSLYTLLSERVKKRVKLIAERFGHGIEEQRPQYFHNLRAGHDDGDFLFVPKGT